MAVKAKCCRSDEEPANCTTYLTQRKKGIHRLRNHRYSQPAVLQVGDLLVTGQWVLSVPVRMKNGDYAFFISDGKSNLRVVVSERLPIALLTSADRLPVGYVDLKPSFA